MLSSVAGRNVFTSFSSAYAWYVSLRRSGSVNAATGLASRLGFKGDRSALKQISAATMSAASSPRGSVPSGSARRAIASKRRLARQRRTSAAVSLATLAARSLAFMDTSV
eukprot:scaffold5438_cov237-Pinguiococcus_pyrenoidosus.AAC.6